MTQKTMSIWEHLDELRKRLFLSAVVVILISGVCYAYWEIILGLLVKPIGDRQLVYLSVVDPFIARFKLAAWSGFIISFPFVLYQSLAFVAPALNRREKWFMFVMVVMAVVLFSAGIYLCYQHVLSVGIEWLESQGSGLLKASLTVNDYISFTGLFLLGFGFAFQTPIVIILLARLGIIRPITMLKQWRLAATVILLVSAIITPDWSPVTMAMMAVPMLGLYLLGVGFAFLFAPRKKFEEIGVEV